MHIEKIEQLLEQQTGISDKISRMEQILSKGNVNEQKPTSKVVVDYNELSERLDKLERVIKQIVMELEGKPGVRVRVDQEVKKQPPTHIVEKPAPVVKKQPEFSLGEENITSITDSTSVDTSNEAVDLWGKPTSDPNSPTPIPSANPLSANEAKQQGELNFVSSPSGEVLNPSELKEVMEVIRDSISDGKHNRESIQKNLQNLGASSPALLTRNNLQPFLTNLEGK